MSEKNHSDVIYKIEDKPPFHSSLLLAFQHYLTMFGSTVAIPLFMFDHLGIEKAADKAALIGTMFFVSGITTLLQTTWGNRLPIVQGGTFSFIPPAVAICGMAHLSELGWQARICHIQAAVIIGSLFEIFIGYTGLVAKVKKLIGPVVIAPTIALIGLALFKYGAPMAASDWRIGSLCIILIILFSQYLRNHHKVFMLFPVMLGIILSWVAAWLGTKLGYFVEGDAAYVTFENVKNAPWLRIPTPFQWGNPFSSKHGELSIWLLSASIGMLAGYVASIVESIGDYFACARLSGAPEPDDKTIRRGIGMEGIGCLIAGIFGTGNGTTSYSENIGAIGLTRVGSRRVIQIGGGLMIIFGAFTKFGAIFTGIPQPIVGAMYCVMFGMIAGVGLSNLQNVNLNSSRNIFIVGFAIFMGLSVPEFFNANADPFSLEKSAWLAGLSTNAATFFKGFAEITTTLGKSGMAVGAICAMILDNTVPKT